MATPESLGKLRKLRAKKILLTAVIRNLTDDRTTRQL